MKIFKIILAILLGWSAPLVVLGIWIWLMRTKKYEDYSIERRTMWIVFGGVLSPLVVVLLCLAGGAIIEAIPAKDECSYDPDYSLEYMSTLTDVAFVPSEECEETCMTQSDDQSVKYVVVNDEWSFVDALGSNRIIQIADNVELNLSKVVYDENFFTASGRLYAGVDTQVDMASSLVFSDDNGYTRELTLYNLKNLTIKAATGARIVVDDSASTVMEFICCDNVKLENLTFGHNTEADCSGDVLDIDKCDGFTLKNCDLFGSGAYGFLAYESENILVEKSIIRECTLGLMCLTSCQDVTFAGCQFLRTESYCLIEIFGDSRNIFFENDVFEGNKGELFSLSESYGQGPIYMKSCKIYHDLADIGHFTSDMVIQLDNTTVVYPSVGDKRAINQLLESRAKPIDSASSRKFSDPDLIRRLIMAPDMPSFDTESFEYTDADGNKVTLIRCKVNPDISEDEWQAVSTMADNNNYRLYAYGVLGTHYKRGWTVASNMNVPDGIAEEMCIDLQYPIDGAHEFYLQFYQNTGGRKLSKEYLKQALYNMVGITVPDFEVVNYVKDYVVVLQCKESLSDLVSKVAGTEGWTECVFIDEGDWNYYNKAEDWQVELHADIDVIKIRLYSWAN